MGPAKPTSSASGKYVSYAVLVAPGGGKMSEVVAPAKLDAECGNAAANGSAASRSAGTMLDDQRECPGQQMTSTAIYAAAEVAAVTDGLGGTSSTWSRRRSDK